MARELKLTLPPADDLFTTQEERDDAKREKVIDIPRSEIDSFPDHPFQVKVDESMLALVESVKLYGVLVPATVRQKEDGRYEYVAGHRRDKACELAGLDTIPCIVRQMSRDEAIIAMVDSNLQRDVILPSEKAKSYKMRLEAMNRQSGRPKNNPTPVVSDFKKPRTNEELAEVVGESREQIRRYIRLTELIPVLLDMVDDGQISMRPAVEVSYLTDEQQQALQDVIEAEERAPSHAQAVKLRKFSEEGKLNGDVILSIMQEDKPVSQGHFKLPKDKIRRFFSADTSAEVIEETIVKALELWRNSNKKN